MTAAWPGTVPAIPAREGYGLKADKNIETSQPDRGPSRSRRLFTAVPTSASVSFRWTVAEYGAFLTFLDGTLGGGALPVLWTEPLTATEYEAKIKDGLGGLQVVPGPGTKVTVSMVLELRV